MLNKIIEKYKNYSNGLGYTFQINVEDFNDLIKMAKKSIKSQTKVTKEIIMTERELDKLIAEKVYGWLDFWENDEYLMGYPPEEQKLGVGYDERSPIPNFSKEPNNLIRLIVAQEKEIEALQETSIINGNIVVKYEEALRHIKKCYPIPAENTDLIPIEVLYEIQLIIKKVLGI